jgi:MFS family permease
VSGVWDRAHRVLTIALVLTVSMAAFEAIAVATILPATVADIGGLDLYGWAFSAFMLAEIVGISIAGAAGDARGLARPFVAGGVLFGAGLVGAGVAGSMPVLVACRAVQGLGAGAISTLAYAAVARGYAEAARPRMLALLSTAWVVPGLIAPAVAAAVDLYAGWRWVFLGLAVPSVAAVGLAVPGLGALGASPDAPPGTSRAPAACVLAGGVSVLLFALGLEPAPSVIAVAVVAVVVSLASFRRLTPTGTLRAAAGLPAAVLVMGVLSAAFFGAEVFVPLSLTDVRHRSVAFAGIALTAATLCWTTGAWLHARFAPYTSRRVLVASGLALLAVGIAGMAAVLLPSVPPLAAPIAWGTAGLGMGIAYSTTSLVVLERAPRGEEGTASAAMQLANVLGAAIGTGAGGAVMARAGTPTAAIGLTDSLAFAAALAAVALSFRLPGKPDA